MSRSRHLAVSVRAAGAEWKGPDSRSEGNGHFCSAWITRNAESAVSRTCVLASAVPGIGRHAWQFAAASANTARGIGSHAWQFAAASANTARGIGSHAWQFAAASANTARGIGSHAWQFAAASERRPNPTASKTRAAHTPPIDMIGGRRSILHSNRGKRSDGDTPGHEAAILRAQLAGRDEDRTLASPSDAVSLISRLGN
jgi:predicted small secreted protein